MAINWQEVLTTVGTTVGSGAILLGGASYLIKTALAHRLTLESEGFKARLKADADAEIEQLKNSLQMTALEHQVRFSKLHEKRAEVIADLYQRLVMASNEAQEFVQVEGLKDRSKFFDHLDNLRAITAFIQTHRIYFPEEVCALLDKCTEAMRGPVIDIGIHAIFEATNVSEEGMPPSEELARAYQTFEREVPAALRALEAAFRAMLGETPAKPLDDGH